MFVRVITNHITNCMEQSPFSGPNRASVNKFWTFYLTQRFHYSFHKSPTAGPYLEADQSSPCLPYNFFKTTDENMLRPISSITPASFITPFSITRRLARTILSRLEELTVFDAKWNIILATRWLAQGIVVIRDFVYFGKVSILCCMLSPG